MPVVEKPLDQQPWQDVEHGKDHIEKLKHLHSGEKIGVHKSIHGSGSALHCHNTGATCGVALGGEVEVPPPGEFLVGGGVHELRAPRLGEAVVQHPDHVRVLVVLRGVVDNPCQVGQVQGLQRCIWRTPGHGTHWVWLCVTFAPEYTPGQPQGEGRALVIGHTPGQHAHDGLHVVGRCYPICGADVEANADDHEESEDHDKGHAVDARADFAQAP
mmetsp:Transcript_65579/g.191922  ORF Transcript_65579/g.191922 Transcript_65579/m.191922 type:complete len:215 (+) Transcript_65579:855-1499(+)